MAAAARPRDPDEALRAMIDRQATVIEELLATVPLTAFASGATQVAIHTAQALLVELGRGAPDRYAAINAVWLASRERTP